MAYSMLQNNKKIFALILTLLFSINACAKEPPAESTEGTERTLAQTVVSQEDTETESISAPAAEYSSFDLNTQTKDRAVYIQFSGSEAVYDDDAVQDKDGILTITRAGDYVLTGTSLCQVVVDAGAEDDVHLILDNLTLTADMAPLYIKKAKNICITLAEFRKQDHRYSAVHIFRDGGRT